MQCSKYRKIIKKKEQKEQKYDKYRNFNWVFSLEHLYESYRKTIKGVKWKNSAQKYRLKVLPNLYETFQKLSNQTFQSKGFYEFDLIERGKPRHIKSVHISERIVQRCLCDYCLVPLLSRKLIYDNGASLKKKGYDFSVRRVKQFLRQSTKEDYALIFDFSKYFDNISHKVVFSILNNLRLDKKLLKLSAHFISVFGSQGLGLGSQISQILAVAYPNELDHFIVDKCNIKKYQRYMDDGVIISNSKDKLKEILVHLKTLCNQHYIILNEKKTKIIKLSKGFKFLKIYFHYGKHNKVLTKPAKEKYRRQKNRIIKLYNKGLPLSDIYQSTASWIGHMKKFSSSYYIYRIKKILKGVQKWNTQHTQPLTAVLFVGI